MPERYDDSPRKRPRRRSRSPAGGARYHNERSPRRMSYTEEDRRHSKRTAREDSGSPPRRRRRSASREGKHRRRNREDSFDDSRTRSPRRHTDSREDRVYSRRNSDSRARPSKHQRHDSRSPPPRRRRHESDSPNPRDHHSSSRDHIDSHDKKKPPRHRDDRTSLTHPPPKRSHAPLPSQQAAFTKTTDPSSDVADKPEKLKPNYAPSGLLAAETNTVANTNIVLKYNEPPESRLPPPSQPWRLYVFKNKDLLDTIPLHTRTCWLFGRETAVCDVAVEHPSASKQHAVLQFRYLEKVVGEYGEKRGTVGLYVLDLESANGTRLNGEGLPGRRFVECKSGDMVQFGESTREYVVLLPPKE